MATTAKKILITTTTSKTTFTLALKLTKAMIITLSNNWTSLMHAIVQGHGRLSWDPTCHAFIPIHTPLLIRLS